MVTKNLDAEKRSAESPAEPDTAADDEREASGLPGRPMALLIAVGLAALSAVIAWLVTGGFAALLG